MIALDVPGFEMSVVPLEISLVSVLLEQEENSSLVGHNTQGPGTLGPVCQPLGSVLVSYILPLLPLVR